MSRISKVLGCVSACQRCPRIDHYANFFSFKSLRCVPLVCAPGIERYEQGGTTGNGIIRYTVMIIITVMYILRPFTSTWFGSLNENCTTVLSHLSTVAGASEQYLWHLALYIHTCSVLYWIRLFPHHGFGLFQIVTLSTPVRDALTVSEFLSCHD